MTTDARFASLRAREFARLDAEDLVYLDYTGSGLAPESLIRTHAQHLLSDCRGNPHSESGPSLRSTAEMERARARILRFFDADPDEYCAIFTSNASSAIRCVGEAFPFRDGSVFALTPDNHNSVNGLRLFAEARRTRVHYVAAGGGDGRGVSLPVSADGAPGLFAYPAQSNFSGALYPLQWVRQAQETGYRVLLDAAAYVPTHRLSLREIPADFVCISFYKMFGYPTGIGALLARREALAELERPWFAGGTVEWATVQTNGHRWRPWEGAFEDGTPNFLAMDAVELGLEFLDEVGIEAIAQHVETLTKRTLDGLRRILHSNGEPVVRIYGPGTSSNRGGTVAFNLLEPSGAATPYLDVECAAREEGIAIRGGCFCNPGASELAFRTDPDRTRRCLDESVPGTFSPQRLANCLETAEVGALRVSFGMATTPEDVDRFLEFVSRFSLRSYVRPDPGRSRPE